MGTRHGYRVVSSGARIHLIWSERADMRRYRVSYATPAPHELRLQLQLGTEEDGVWAHIPELDVSAEGESVSEALRNVVSAAREWLTYLREEAPELAPEIAAQERYAALLDAPIFSWFKNVHFAE